MLGEDHAGHREEMVRAMVAENAELALKTLISDGDVRAADLSNAIEEWTLLDSAGVAAWYKSQEDTLSAIEQEIVMTARFTVMLGAMDIDSAAEILADTPDENLRAKMAIDLAEAISRQ